MIKIDTTGLEKLQDNLESLSGTHEVSTNDLMTDKFIISETSFGTWEALMNAANVQSSEDLESKWFSDFIRSHTKFDGFQDMLENAAQSYVISRLGL